MFLPNSQKAQKQLKEKENCSRAALSAKQKLLKKRIRKRKSFYSSRKEQYKNSIIKVYSTYIQKGEGESRLYHWRVFKQQLHLLSKSPLARSCQKIYNLTTVQFWQDQILRFARVVVPFKMQNFSTKCPTCQRVAPRAQNKGVEEIDTKIFYITTYTTSLINLVTSLETLNKYLS